MITLLRNSLKDGGMTTIIWVAVGSMIIGSALPLVMKKSSGDWALRVNGTEIPYTTYAAELALIRDYVSMLRTQYGQFAEYLLQSMGFSDPQTMTMQQLINQQLMVHGYTAQGISIGQASVNRKLSDKSFVEESCGDLLPSFLYKEGQIDNSMLKHYLQQRAMTVEQLQQRIQERIGTVFMSRALENLAYIPRASRAEAATLQGATRDLAIVRIPLETYKKAVAKDITNEQVQAFYEQENARMRRYYVPEKRSGSVWEFDAQGYGVIVDADAIERYYEEHKASRYQKEPATMTVRALGFATQEEAEAARKDLIEGKATVKELAQQYPFDAESAAQGGLLKPITRGSGDRAIERAAFILAEDGALSSVIAHNGKFVLLERVSKSAPVFTPLAKVRDEIKEQLQAATFKETCLRELNELIRAHDDAALKSFIKEHKGKRSEHTAALSEATTDAQKAFFALEKGAYSGITSGNRCYLVQVDAINPTVVQPFETVSAQVRADMVENKAQHALSQAVIDFNHAIAQQGIRAAAAEKGLSVETYKGLSIADAAKLKAFGVDASVLGKLVKVGTVAPVQHQGDAIIVALEGITPAPIERGSKDDEASANMLKREHQTIIAAYIASLYRDATIEKNDILALLDKENTI